MTRHERIETASIRDASPQDAAILRRVFELAGHGLAETFWRKAHTPGTDFDRLVEDRMAKKIADPANRFRIALIGGVPAGGVLSYDKTDDPEEPGDAGPMLRALIEAENDLLATHYINALAVFPFFRKRGIGEALVRDVAAHTTRDLGLIAADGNPDALRLYRRFGFEDVARHAMEAEDWTPNGRYWISMIRRA